MNNVNVVVSVKEYRIEVNGSEEFVTRELQDIKNEVFNNTEQLNTSPLIKANKEQQANPTSPTHTHAESISIVSQNKYPKLFNIDGEEVHLTINSSAIPGNTTATKMVNLSLLFLLAKKYAGVTEINMSEIRSLCNKYGCIDKGNFSTIFKKKPNIFLVKGKNSSSTIELTVPGKEKAEEIAQLINANQ